MTTEKTLPPFAAMKKKFPLLLFAASLLFVSSGSCQTPLSDPAGNCYRITTAEEQAQGAGTIIQVDSCRSYSGTVCLLLEKHSASPDRIMTRRYVSVSYCDKYSSAEHESPQEQ